MTKNKERLDQALVARGLATDLPQAQALIMGAKVVVNQQMVDKAGVVVSADDEIRLKGDCPYVSRAGMKMAGAVEDLKIEGLFKNQIVLDVGASTGGFTDYCLKNGALKVVAVDVGTNQLDWSLRQSDRVDVMENTDIRQLDPATIDPVDWLVADLSFISLRTVLATLASFAVKPEMKFLLLIKPQFEVRKELLPPGGVLADESLRQATVDEVRDYMEKEGFKILGLADSRVKGRQGNLETFIYAERA